MRVLNLYAGIGGNRKLWTDVEVTAIELNPQIAKVYQDFFPKDKVIVADAHQYLLDHFKEFEFIWSSPPCPSHSRARQWNVQRKNIKKIYPDMSLYQEIIFLKHHYKGKWVIENVIPYYKPLIPAQICGRHLFWANFRIKNIRIEKKFFKDCFSKLQEIYGFDIRKYHIGQRKDQILRNCVLPELGLHILNESKKDIQAELFR